MGARKQKILQEGCANIILMDSVAEMSAEEAGQVVVAGSHGSASAARHAARYAPFGLFLNDAGKGKQDAGISGLPVLQAMGILGASVDCMSARIGDGADGYHSGVVSAANDRAREAGIREEMPVSEAAALMLAAQRFAGNPGKPQVVYEGRRGRIIVTDTIAYLTEAHRGCVVVGGSHCAHTTYSFVAGLSLKGILLNDAGRGKNEAGISGLAAYQRGSVPAGAVDCMSAMIGNGLDTWENGIVSAANELAHRRGVVAGMCVQEAAGKLLEARGKIVAGK